MTCLDGQGLARPMLECMLGALAILAPPVLLAWNLWRDHRRRITDNGKGRPVLNHRTPDESI